MQKTSILRTSRQHLDRRRQRTHTPDQLFLSVSHKYESRKMIQVNIMDAIGKKNNSPPTLNTCLLFINFRSAGRSSFRTCLVDVTFVCDYDDIKK
ncbi:hypothetical protein CEXT_377411 [Caerostris extrusa]|uniref:Uncharacterized protein n=1 Tax=Caerostris extrusa TaxID=172846 RepID=A0AAV4QET3_CAEEX|nr:hypothetical protein CEXT_377411 [Caerostris extrusa]